MIRLPSILLPLLAAALLAEDQGTPKDPGLSTAQILERLQSPEKATKASAMRALGQRKAKEGVAPISACLADRDEQVRVAALDALGDIGDASAVPAILGCLGDTSASVVVAAIRAASRFPAKDVVPALLGILDHPQPGVRENAFEALRGLTRLDFGYAPDQPLEERAKRIGVWRAWWAKAGGREPVEWWRGELGSPLTSHRVSCGRALGEACCVEAVPDLLGLLEDAETPVRFEAGRALAAITSFDLGFDAYAPPQERQLSVDKWRRWWRDHQGKPRKEWLVSGIADPDPRNRLAAIRGIERLATAGGGLSGAAEDGSALATGAVPLLVAALDDVEEGVREGANAALRSITARDEGFDASSKDTERLIAVARWQEWWKQNQARRPMDWWEATLLSDDSPLNKAAAARRLGEVKEWESIRYLAQGLEDDAAGVRAAAIEGLAKLTGETLGFDPDTEEEGRKAAVARWEEWMVRNRDIWKPR